MLRVMPSSTSSASDHFFTTSDGVRLYWREWAGPESRPAVLCLPGLTRNTRDFLDLGACLAGRFRVLAPSFRGRGRSANAADPMTYVPPTYVADMQALLQSSGIPRVVVIGTSLGGIVGLLLTTVAPDLVAGLVMNDIGAEVDPAGLARIATYVGKGGGWADWDAAAQALKAAQGPIFPRWTDADWLAHAERLCREDAGGKIVWDYDPAIAVPFRNQPAGAAPDLWAPLLACRAPILSLHGTLSDILSADMQREMARRQPLVTAATVPDVGHAPTLAEPEALAVLDRWLQQFEG